MQINNGAGNPGAIMMNDHEIEMGRRGSGSGSGSGGPCGACKFLRRKCVKSGCVFAPYFDSDQGTAHFAAVHKVFGASNASKLLHRLPPHKRLDAVVTLCYEALARLADPVYGCVSTIFTLQQQVVQLQEEVALVQARLSTLQSLMLQPTTTTTDDLPYFDPIMSASVLAVTTPAACSSPLPPTLMSDISDDHIN